LKDFLDYLNVRIAELVKLREQYEAEGDQSMDMYIAGGMDAYESIRMELEERFGIE
jgi:hypothetical protein